jgi:hypothetical protein
VRNKSRIRIRKERTKVRKRAITMTKIQGRTMAVNSMEVIAAVTVVIVLDPTKTPERNHHRINVKEFTAD